MKSPPFPPPPLPDGELRARYAVTCPCGHGFELGPSLAMQMGLNSGHVTCPACHTFHHVELAGDGATVEPWDAYKERWVEAPAEPVAEA